MSGPAPVRKLADRLPCAELHVLPGAHMSPFLDPAALTALITGATREGRALDGHER